MSMQNFARRTMRCLRADVALDHPISPLNAQYSTLPHWLGAVFLNRSTFHGMRRLLLCSVVRLNVQLSVSGEGV